MSAEKSSWKLESDFYFNDGMKIPSHTIKKWHQEVLQSLIDGQPYHTINSGNSMVIGRIVHYAHETEPKIEIIEITNGYARYTYAETEPPTQ